MERNYAIDFIKGIGLLLIVALHINIFGAFHWLANWFVNTGVRFVVPFFFLTSGYLLFQKLQRSENRQKVFENYVKRILTYYFGGFVLCFAFDYFVVTPLWNMPGVFFRGYMSGSFWTDFLYYGLIHMSGFHLWFLLAMFWAGFVIFLVCRKEIHKIKIVALVAFIIHLVGLCGITQPYSQFFVIPLFPRDALFFGLFYMSLGGAWALGGINIKKYIPKKYNVWAIVLFFGLQFAERSALVFGMGAPEGQYWGEYFIATIPLTMILFQYALDNGENFKNSIFTKVGEKSVDVYISHLIAINITFFVLNAVDKEIARHPLLQIGQVFAIVAMSYIFYFIFLKVYAGRKKIFRTVTK